MGTVVDFVVAHIMAATVHHISWAAARARACENSWTASWARQSGPYKAHISWAAARPGPSNFHMMGRGPARSIKLPHDGPQPGPARPTNFSKLSARPGPAHHIFSFFGPARRRPITFSKISARPGPARTFGP